jgi:N4-gp56 family major capsid protein
MAVTTLATDSRVQKFLSQFLAEYTRDSGFRPYMSRGANSVICAKYELTSGGKTLNIPLVTRLTGAGVTGNSTLNGNEEALGNYNQSIAIEWYRNAVTLTKAEQHYSMFDMLRAARDQLQIWASSSLRDDIIAAMQSIDGVAYGTATEAQKDAWLDNNTDRVLFGAAKSNVSQSAPAGGATNDHSASLANIDNTDDKLTSGKVQLMKRIAKTADPHIRPMRHQADGTREYYVLFCNSLQFRDLSADTVIQQANRDARPRNVDSNPLFQSGDLIYDGVIIREIPEIPVISGAGASSIDVAPAFLCGAQAVGLAWGQEPTATRKVEDDYGFAPGVGIEEARGVEKMRFNDKDHGMVTGYFASVADT